MVLMRLLYRSDSQKDVTWQTCANSKAAGTIERMQPKKTRRPLVVMETTKGVIKFVLYPEISPKTCANFIKLVKKGFYDGLTFHRVESNFVIQGGDPKGDSSGGPGWSIPNEKNGPLKHNRGAVAMANAGRDTAGSQFYVVIGKPAPNLDEKEADGMSKYTIFGQVVNGQDAAERIKIGDKMMKVTVQE